MPKMMAPVTKKPFCKILRIKENKLAKEKFKTPKDEIPLLKRSWATEAVTMGIIKIR